MKIEKVLEQPPIQLAIAAVIVIGVVYFIIRKTVSDVGQATGLSTKGTEYEGAGTVGILGNVANKLSGGSLAAVGSKVADFFIPKDRSPNVFYTATFPNNERHAIPSTEVDSAGFFFRNGVRYRLATGTDGKRLAIAA